MLKEDIIEPDPSVIEHEERRKLVAKNTWLPNSFTFAKDGPAYAYKPDNLLCYLEVTDDEPTLWTHVLDFGTQEEV